MKTKIMVIAFAFLALACSKSKAWRISAQTCIDFTSPSHLKEAIGDQNADSFKLMESCPQANVLVTCKFPSGQISNWYAGIDSDTLKDVEKKCAENQGTWSKK